MIPDEAVEAAAKALASRNRSPEEWQWYISEARSALEAAAPHLTPSYDDVFGAVYAATDKSDWAVSEVADAVMAVLRAEKTPDAG